MILSSFSAGPVPNMTDSPGDVLNGPAQQAAGVVAVQRAGCHWPSGSAP